jgi:hypothetical protein
MAVDDDDGDGGACSFCYETNVKTFFIIFFLSFWQFSHLNAHHRK